EAPNAQGDFNNPGNKGPVWLSMMAGGGHGSGPWDGAAANVAWMRWHIGGENSRKADFLGDGGAYNDTGIWQTDFKNWDGWKNCTEVPTPRPQPDHLIINTTPERILSPGVFISV